MLRREQAAARGSSNAWLPGVRPPCSPTLPRLDFTCLNLEQRMGLWKPQITPLSMERRIALRQLGHEMRPFVGHLTGSYGEGHGLPGGFDLIFVERIPARFSLLMNGLQISRNGCKRRGVVLEAIQLRVIAVAAGFSTQNSLGKQCFSP